MEKKIYLILLASGLSKRFGENKLLLEINNKYLYRYVLEAYSKIDFYKKIIVSKYEEILDYARKSTDFITVYNDEAELGVSSSIKKAVSYIKESKDFDENTGFMFAVCDQPLTRTETIIKLIEAFNEEDKGIIVPFCNNNMYNPKIFSSKYSDELLDLSGDNGGKTLIKKNMSDLFYVIFNNEEEFFDIDTRENFELIKYRI